MLLADRLNMPAGTSALLFGLDGVLVDSRSVKTPVNTQPGIPEIISAAKKEGIAIAVVSNNSKAEIDAILDRASLSVDLVVGNDEAGLQRKPATNLYVEAVNRLGRRPEQCVVIESSLLGVKAASNAGCYTIAVATGADSFDDLEDSSYTSLCYTRFTPCYVSLGRKGVTNKILNSPNDFVSHMIEHIAWRLGCSIDLSWTNDDWRELGRALGQQVRQFPIRREAASAIGMIDDGSADISISVAESGGVVTTASEQVDLEWFLGCRAEQLSNGAPLLEILQGLGEAANLDIQVRVAAVEDAHHTWEGVFRGVGMVLDKMFNEPPEEPKPPFDAAARLSSGKGLEAGQQVVEQGWTIDGISEWGASVQRRTAESNVALKLSLGSPSVRFSVDVADSINVAGLADLLREFAEGANLQLDVTFEATRLSSSHVAAEDIGMTIGRALRYVAIERMSKFGIHGAGSNIDTPADCQEKAIRVGVSMEGRKFWKYVPMSQDYGTFRKNFLMGHTLPNGIFSEDLDDFIDGLAGAFQISIIVHLDGDPDPIAGWPVVFRGLGEAMAGLLATNPYRLALTPGVKATLA